MPEIPSEKPRARILYVEDDQWDADGTIKFLRYYYELETVRGSSDARNKLIANSKKYDLILLDIRLHNPLLPPDSDDDTRAGYDFVISISREVKHFNLPIITYTNLVPAGMATALIDAGVETIVKKNQPIQELKETIDRVLKARA
ncbi:MAG: response regulator [Chloroflexi bacterium]|nr:MAG: hypothetical protein CUN54_05215 [Phototrophicales bacterium]RMF79757.1 MAG: response regulator [Chloroflexota bacterium]